jgi:hypothetical protein
MAKAAQLASVSGEAPADPEAPFGRKADGTPKKRRGSSGPRQRKPVHVVFRVTDESGEPVKGKLDIIYVGTDTDKLLGAMDENPGAQRTKVQL